MNANTTAICLMKCKYSYGAPTQLYIKITTNDKKTHLRVLQCEINYALSTCFRFNLKIEKEIGLVQNLARYLRGCWDRQL